MRLRARASRRLVPTLLLALVACQDDAAGPGRDSTTTPVDGIPPAAVDDLSLAFRSSDGAVAFNWTAPRDDIAHDRAHRYDIRYGYAFPFDWDRSVPVDDPPAPLRAGTIQTYTLSDPRRGRDLFAAIRAFDAAGNASAVGTVAHLRVPGFTFEVTCLDVLARGPAAGLDALVATRFSYHAVTDAAGRFALADLAGGALGIVIETGAASGLYHRFEDAFTLEDDVTLVYSMIPFRRPASALYPSTLGILGDALIAPGPVRIVKNWRERPVAWYAPDFVNVHGLDYRSLAEQAASRWNERVGLDLLIPATSPPQRGVVLQFLPRSQMGTQNGITSYTNDAEGFPLLDTIRIVDDFADAVVLYRIMVHEFGHTIRLGHLPAGFMMYGGQPLPPDITDDEVDVVRLLVSLPGGLDVSKYDPAPPAR
jgi:hypothetical protein